MWLAVLNTVLTVIYILDLGESEKRNELDWLEAVNNILIKMDCKFLNMHDNFEFEI